MYDVVEVCRDRIKDSGADVRGCVVRGSVVRIAYAGGQVADEVAQLLPVVIAHVVVDYPRALVENRTFVASGDDSQP